MAQQAVGDRAVLRDLGDGLVLRRATGADAEAVADQQATMHSDNGPDKPDEAIRAWVLDLMSGNHPTFRPDDFTVVEDARTGQIVSAVCLISQTWLYGGVPFKVGQPELVATLPEYRRRGLVRAQFEVIHRWSVERGELVQAITGIPWYYRQFGYEMALPLGGLRGGFKPQIPQLPEGQEEPYHFRPAADEDIPFMAEMYARGAGRSLIATVRNEAMWRYDLHGHREGSMARNQLHIVETAEGEPVGLLVHRGEGWGSPSAIVYELKPGASWHQVSPCVMRYLARTGEEAAREKGGEFMGIGFRLGTEHPVYHALADRLPRHRPPYAWYVRVPDIPGFLRHVAAALERRLAGSILSGYTGECKLNFYTGSLRLEFKEGKLVGSDTWQPSSTNDGNAGIPGLTFLQMVFGHRSLEELEYAYPDAWVNGDEARLLLTTLFPKQVSNVWPVG